MKIKTKTVEEIKMEELNKILAEKEEEFKLAKNLLKIASHNLNEAQTNAYKFYVGNFKQPIRSF
jgi:hypothetical protein